MNQKNRISITFKRITTVIKLLSVSILCFSTLCFAQDGEPSIQMEFGKGIKFTSTDSLFTLSMSGRIQSLFQGKTDLTDDTSTADFFVRRSRLNFQGTALNPNFTYRIQIGFTQNDITSANSMVQNNLVLRDAMLFYQANKWLRIGFGQTKLPGNRQRRFSSANLQLVERAIANNNFTLDRDKGIWLYSNFNIHNSVLRTTMAVSSGEGRINSAKNGKLSYAARTEFLPFGAFLNNGDYIGGDQEREQKPKLSLGAVYSFNNDATRTMGQLGEFLFNAETADIRYYGGDLIFKYKGFSLLSELYTRSSDKGIVTNNLDPTQQNAINSGTAFMVQSGYFITKKNEIALRFAQLTPDAEASTVWNAQKEHVLGFSHYFKKHSLKLQSDITCLENGQNDGLIYRLSGVVTF